MKKRKFKKLNKEKSENNCDTCYWYDSLERNAPCIVCFGNSRYVNKKDINSKK